MLPDVCDYFFFSSRRRHTRCYRDWSSDVCSSDLETRTFGTTRAELESLGDWLACWGVTKTGMEATSDYWKPVFFLLESRGLDCQLYNAAQVKALPGRPKTDRADSIWLARITERGTVCSSFVPPEPIRRLRTHTRYRRHLTQAR